MAASGDDEGIKLIDTASNKVFRQLPSVAYTRGLAYDPESDFLASIAADGTLTIWNLQNGKAVAVKRRACSKIDVSAPIRLLPSWHPDGGSLLAAPGADGTVLLLERLSWEVTEELSDGHEGAVHVVAFSPNGSYLASAGEDAGIVVWDVNEKTIIEKKTLPGVVCTLMWHPSRNELLATTDDGQLALWKHPIPETLPGPSEIFPQEKDVLDRHGATRLIDDAAAEDDGEEEEDGENGRYGGGRSRGDERYGLESEEGSDLEGRDDGGTRKKFRRSQRYNRRHRVPGYEHDGSMTLSFADPVAAMPQPQDPIQPGSTTMEAGRRYLSYTALGSITLRTESDHNVVEVAFHDISRVKKRIPLLTDFFGFTLGSLGEEGAIYASPASADVRSTVVYRPFEAWAPNSDWTVSLPKGEDATCVAVGQTFVSVATTARRLRIFTQAGLQRDAIDLPGEAIALAARGSQLAVAWHACAPTYDGRQCLHVSTYDINERKRLHDGPLPLTSASTLLWMGYSEEGLLAAYDTQGILRVLTPDFGGSWISVFDASQERKGSESFWVFALSLQASEVHCIVCANSHEPTVPSGSARPVVTAAPLHFPLLTTTKEDIIAPLESQMVRLSALTAHSLYALQEESMHPEDPSSLSALEEEVQRHRVEADRVALKLFAKLLSLDQQVKALEVASMMHTDPALDGARRRGQKLQSTSAPARLPLEWSIC